MALVLVLERLVGLCWTGPSAYTNEEHNIWSGGSTIAGHGVQLKHLRCGS